MQKIKSIPWGWGAVVLGFISFFLWTSILGLESSKSTKIKLREMHAVENPIEESKGMSLSIDDAQFAPTIELPIGEWSGVLTSVEKTDEMQIAVKLEIGEEKTFSIEQIFYDKGEEVYSNSASGFLEVQGKVIRFNVSAGKRGFFSTTRRLVIQSVNENEMLVRGVIAGHEEQSLVMRKIKPE